MNMLWRLRSVSSFDNKDYSTILKKMWFTYLAICRKKVKTVNYNRCFYRLGR